MIDKWGCGCFFVWVGDIDYFGIGVFVGKFYFWDDRCVLFF